MISHFIEAESDEGNWGKFMVACFEPEEWRRRSAVDPLRGLLGTIGWDAANPQVIVFDLQTCEGAAFRPGGHAHNDLNEKHKVWVCPLFEPFLEWLYANWNEYERVSREGSNAEWRAARGANPVADWIEQLPPIVKLTGVPLQMYGYRRTGEQAKRAESA